MFYTTGSDVDPPVVNRVPNRVGTDSSTNTSVFNISWSLPTNAAQFDIDRYEVEIDGDVEIIAGKSTLYTLVSLTHGLHEVKIYAVDRCNHRSNGTFMAFFADEILEELPNTPCEFVIKIGLMVII